MKVKLVINPVAGNRAYRHIENLKRILQKQDVSLSTFITSARGDALEFSRNLTDCDRLIVASGDGTINEVVNGLMTAGNPEAREIPVAIIPLGITNVLALELGVPGNITKSAELALRGRPRKISLGRINRRYFTLMAGIGFDGETVSHIKNNLLKKISGKAAHIAAGLKVLLGYYPSPVHIKTEDKEISCYNAIISNSRCYGGMFYISPEASISDGLLDVCVFMGGSRLDILRYVAGIISGHHLRYRDVKTFRASRLDVTTEGRVHVQIDGDYFGTLPASIDVVEDAVHFVC